MIVLHLLPTQTLQISGVPNETCILFIVSAKLVCYLYLKTGCYSNPCKFGSTCQEGGSVDQYTCLCSQGFSGQNCDEVTGKKNKICLYFFSIEIFDNIAIHMKLVK